VPAVFFGPRIPAVGACWATCDRAKLVIGLVLLVPTLAIASWPRLAIDFYGASTTACPDLCQQSVSPSAGFPPWVLSPRRRWRIG